MSHHGPGPFNDPDNPKLAEQFRKIMTEAKVGPTGDFPEGRLVPDDEGGIRFVVVQHGQKIVMSFGKAVEWIGFNADQAIELATLRSSALAKQRAF